MEPAEAGDVRREDCAMTGGVQTRLNLINLDVMSATGPPWAVTSGLCTELTGPSRPFTSAGLLTDDHLL